MNDSDGIDESFDHTLRTALMAAARAGETIARLREQQQRQAEARSRQEAVELRARFSAEQAAARAQYEQTRYPDWWDRASLDDVVTTYQTAAAWKDVDPQADAAMRHIEREAKTRHNVDIDPDTAGSAGAAAEQQAARARAEDLEAASLLAAADTADRGAQRAADAGDPAQAEHDRHTAADLTTSAGVVYDSAERRHADAERLTGVADAATVDARVRADTSQAQPATRAADRTRAGRATRSPRGRAPQRQRTPSGRGGR